MIDRTAIERARNDAAFGDSCWLTFYLAGSPEAHAMMQPRLVALKATNLYGAKSGFVYAKVPVEIATSEIKGCISQVRQLASDAKIDIVLIDLDASADVQRSKFYNLWQEPPIE